MQFTSPLMGASFRPAEVKEQIKLLEVGDHLYLERDPENPYDANAVRLIFNDEFLGFVAKEVAGEIAPLLDEGAEGIAEVIGMAGTLKPHLSIIFPDAA